MTKHRLALSPAVIAFVVFGVACAPSPSSPSATVTPSTQASAPAAAACPPIALRLPSGESLDLTGTWRGAQSVVFARQEGSCVWWIALSDFPGQERGSQFMFMFRGEIGTDFMLTGEWIVVVRPGGIGGIAGRRHGSVTFEIDTETLDGEDTVVLRSTTVAGESGAGPYGSVTLEYVGPLPASQPL
jgi:hypothetical protein